MMRILTNSDIPIFNYRGIKKKKIKSEQNGGKEVSIYCTISEITTGNVYSVYIESDLSQVVESSNAIVNMASKQCRRRRFYSLWQQNKMKISGL